MRARNVKPALFKNEVLGEADPLLTILFVGLWGMADREGRLHDRPKRIRAEIFPYRDVTAQAVDEFIGWLETEKFITRYEVDGEKYIQINKWHKHQNPHHKEVASEIPSLDQAMDKSSMDYVPINNETRKKIIERDGGKCVYCQSEESLQVDHIIPVSAKGTSVEDNLQTLCAACNSLKSNYIVDNESCKKHGRTMLETCITHIKSNKIVSSPLIPDSLIPDSGEKPGRFSPPGLDEVSEYFQGKGIVNHEKEAEKFIDFYESKNWMVGKNKMVKWRNAASGWINRMSPGECSGKQNLSKLTDNELLKLAQERGISTVGKTRWQLIEKLEAA